MVPGRGLKVGYGCATLEVRPEYVGQDGSSNMYWLLLMDGAEQESIACAKGDDSMQQYSLGLLRLILIVP